jgi:hypothetical protein
VELGPSLGDLLARMTRMDPEDRPSAREVAHELAAFVGVPTGETMVLPVVTQEPLPETQAVPVADAPHRRRWERLRTSRLALGGAAVVLLVGGSLLIGGLASGGDTPEPPDYPAVQGTLGDWLTQLQESVEP